MCLYCIFNLKLAKLQWFLLTQIAWQKIFPPKKLSLELNWFRLETKPRKTVKKSTIAQQGIETESQFSRLWLSKWLMKLIYEPFRVLLGCIQDLLTPFKS